ncbi:Nif3-like dinuclear metal center hexameric protein [Ruminococcaceae bacterium OttesenSCG-928-L11]|nr:Nif3-like dinuclear metal center hexameric protein [Ruminococcaceae bacterium OttesenSCG-928-L11]
MITVEAYMKAMQTIAPFELAEPWDNPGLLIGGGDREVCGVVVALDATSAVIDEAVEQGANLIVTHHPVIFSPLKSIGADSIPWKLVQAGISVISAHTNLDIAEGGVNDALAEQLGLTNVRPMNESGLGRVGELPAPMESAAFAALVKERLQAPAVRYHAIGDKVKTVALCGGSGGDYLADAIQSGAQAYLTGECKHHIWLEAAEAGILLAEAGHYHTEAVIVEPLAKRLRDMLPQAVVHVSKRCTDGVSAL